ncbi:MAG TPA: DUF4199 domain-containing protein [Bacteroidales bacterium]|nr:DUF4199 domain-containing protein [Bacteroidales bacterium]
MKKQIAILLKWGAILGVALSFIQLVRKFSDSFDFYAFGPIIELLNALLFIGLIYIGIKEVRDDCMDQIISFSKAFVRGLLIVITAFVIVFVYLNLHYGVIFKDQLQVVNEKNMTRFYERLQQDSVTIQERDTILYKQLNQIINQKNLLKQNAEIDSLNAAIIDLRVDTVWQHYSHFMKSQTLPSESFTLGNLDHYSRETILDILGKYIGKYPKTDTLSTYVSSIIINGSDHFKDHSLLDQRFKNEKSKVPLHQNSFSASLYFSLSVILYGILFNIFISMYLYNRKSKQNKE